MTPYCSINPIAFISGMPGGGEMIVLFLVILVLFGPRKLPEIARMIGKTLDQLRNASQDFKDEVMKIEDDVKEDIKSVAQDAIDVSVTDFHDDSPDDGTVEDAIQGMTGDDLETQDDVAIQDGDEVKKKDGGVSSEEDKDLAG